MTDVSGTPGNDDLDGSIDPDLIAGDAGDDSLYGHDGNDSLYGDEGDDLLAGGEGDDLLDGGSGSDTLWGGSGSDTIVFRDGYDDDVVMDFDIAADGISLSSAGVETWSDVSDRIGSDTDGTALLTLDDGSSLRFEGLAPNQLNSSHFTIEPAPICLAAGTKVMTDQGWQSVDALVVGDLIATVDSGFQPLLWIGRYWKTFGHAQHRHHPIRVPTGAFGCGRPYVPLLLSPQHRVLIDDPACQKPGGLFAKAKGLVDRHGIATDTRFTAIQYAQLLVPQHSVVFAEGVPVETFWPGPVAFGSLGTEDRQTLERLFPGIGTDPVAAYGPLARPCLTLRALRALSAGDLRLPPGVAAPHLRRTVA